ncbi:hypothetical protein QCA50_006116 [Cerrena zonata]|uniref:F-box domain-containing protein n=1 Tax=Cerrena zonata TaxID=2478898 RepID=A0AAW0GBV0_9APHY
MCTYQFFVLVHKLLQRLRFGILSTDFLTGIKAMKLDLSRASQVEVEHRITKLSEELSVLKHHLNTYLPIFRLPSELLLEIFSIIVKEWGASLPWDDSRCSSAARAQGRASGCMFPSYDWLPIIHVCQRWRDAAIQLSALWTHVILNRFDFLDAMLTRSRASKISLFYYIPGQLNLAKESRIFDAVRPHLHRVKLLQIVSYAPSCSGPFFSCHLPSVETINLLMLTPHTDPRSQVEPFHSWMDKGHTSLRSLKFINISFAAIQAAIRPTLRNLSIHKMWQTVPTSLFLSALRSVPLLETLTLVEACPRIVSPAQKPVDPRSVVTLPCLRWVQIVSTGSTLVNFLEYLSFTATTAVHLTLRGLHGLEEITSETLGKFFASKLANNPQHIILGDTKSPLDLITRTGSGTSSSICIDSSDNLRVNIIIGSMLSGLITADLDRLSVRITPTQHTDLLKAGIYEAMFAKAHNLQQLYFSSVRLIPSFMRDHREGESGSSERLPLPSLVDLIIDGVQETDDSIVADLLEHRMTWGHERKAICIIPKKWSLRSS